MADLQIPQNINAKKIIKDASVLGFGVLSDSEEASIYQAEKDIKSAQGDVRRANTEVNAAEDKQKSAEAKGNDAQSKQQAGESQSQSGPTQDAVAAKANDAGSISQVSKTRSQSMGESSERLNQAGSIFENMLGTTSEKIDGFSIEISDIQQQNQALMEQNRALMDQMQQESAFDGTGSGTSSAYSLSTATEVQEQQEQNPQSLQGGQSSGSNLQSTIDSNNAQIEANGSRVDGLLQQSQAEQQTLSAQTSQAQAQVQEQQAAAAQAQSSNESEQSTLQTIGAYAQTASNLGGTLDSVGDVVKVAGIGVSAAGTALVTTGGAVGLTGATVTGIGAAITAIGAPLCALFGIGVPIVGAGGTTTGSGVATSATGGTVAGTGSTLIGTGSTIQNVGNGISMTGNALKLAGDATTAGVKIAEGDVMGAIHATANAVSSAAAFSSTITSSAKMQDTFNKVFAGASAVREGIATYQSAENGDVAGAIAHGVSTLGFGVGTSNFKYKQSVSDFSQGISAASGAVQYAMEGDYKNAALQGTQALFNFASGAGNVVVTKANDEIKAYEDKVWKDREKWAHENKGRVYYHEDGTATIISSDDADMLHQKTKNLLGENADSEFEEGIEALQARMLEASRLKEGIEGINEGGNKAKVRDWSGAQRLGVSPELVQDAADLSQFAYNDRVGDAKRLNGWNQFDSQSAENGFHAKAFEKDGRVIIAFRGSDDCGDLKVDHQMLAGQLPDQFMDATQFVERVRSSHPDAEIIVTGHSLGGSLSELTASKFADVKGITFDAVGTKGIVRRQGLTDNENTLNYVVRGDLISNTSKHVGTTVVVDGVRGHDEHAIQNFTGDNNSLVGTEGGLASADSRKRAQTEQRRARSGNTLESAISNSGNGVVRFNDKQFKDVRSQFEIDANSLNADLDRLQRQVNHVADPVQRAELNGILDARRRTLKESCDIARHSKVIKTRTGDEVNKEMRKRGFKEPAFLPGKTPDVQTIELTRETRFVRVFNEGGKPPSFAKGSWVMALEDIQGLTPAQIKDKFALPGMPSHVVELELPAGTELLTGPCNPVEGWGNGGGIQYFITGEKSHKYSNIRDLPPNV